MGKTERQVAARRPITLKAIAEDLKGGDWDALYYATEEQIISLINSNHICEDFLTRHQDYQEEMRIMMNQTIAEFA